MYGNINFTDCNLLNNKMSQESDKYLVDVAPGGGEPRTFVSVSFHGSDLFLLPHLIGVHVMLFHKHLLTNIVKRIF